MLGLLFPYDMPVLSYVRRQRARTHALSPLTLLCRSFANVLVLRNTNCLRGWCTHDCNDASLEALAGNMAV